MGGNGGRKQLRGAEESTFMI